MVNYNMGRYYAYQNLGKLVQSAVRKYSKPPAYQFKYVPPKVTQRAVIVPFEQWKGSTPAFIQEGNEKSLPSASP